MTDSRIVSADAVETRLIRHADLVPCKMAFIDCRIPGSDKKENYSIIGPGVTESDKQVVHLQEPHGFSLGVAAMPPGVTNNLHIHYTAEVFIVFQGDWLFRWGSGGKDGEITGRAGDVVSIPTWIFRGFTNVGSDDGWIFTALGRDDCGGLIWHPSILRQAAELGQYLTLDDVVVDTTSGTPKPLDEQLVEPLSESVISTLDRYTTDDMRQRTLTAAERQWSERALLDSVLDGHRSALAPVIGPGMTEDRLSRPKITNPHGFLVEWLHIDPMQTVGAFRVDRKQVMIVYEGSVEITINRGKDEVVVNANTQDTFSAPEGVWRRLRSIGDRPAVIAVITSGDGRTRIQWDDKLVTEARAAGFVIDPDGYLAPKALMPYRHSDRVNSSSRAERR